MVITNDPYGSAAAATQTICDLTGMYVDRSGNLLSINGVDVTVAEACKRYTLSLEEFTSWQRAVDRSGMPGLVISLSPRSQASASGWS